GAVCAPRARQRQSRSRRRARPEADQRRLVRDRGRAHHADRRGHRPGEAADPRSVGGGDSARRSKTAAMPRIEVSRTLVKSPPELWAELGPDCLEKAVGLVSVEETEPERALAFTGDGVRGTAVLEPAGWGTQVTLTAEHG